MELLRAVSELRTGLAPAARVELSPGVVRRTLQDDSPAGVAVVETAMAFRDAPGAVLQWTPAPGASGTLELSLSWSCELPGGGESARPDSREGPLLVLDDRGGAPRVLFAVAARRVRWRLRRPGPEEPGRIQLEVAGEPGAPVTLLVGAPDGTPASAAALVGRLRHLEAEVHRWSARAPDPTLALTSPEAPVDRALEWTRHRLESWRCDPAPAARERAWIVRGLLAVGAFDDARDLLDSWREELAPEGTRGPRGAPPRRAAAGHLELAGEYLLWSGDRAWLGRRRPGLESLVAGLAASGDDGEASDPDAAVRAVRILAEGAELPGGDAWSRELRGRADALERASGGTEGSTPPDAAADPARRALEAWRRGEVERGLGLWRARLLEGIRGRGGDWGSPGSAGLLPAALLLGMLGARADAAFGRLRLAPAVPVEWDRFSVEGIRVADAAVRLGYRRSGRAHTFVVEQTRGRVPLNLVFEPLLPEGAPGRILVDGQPADVQGDPADGRTRLRLQMPLDSTREVSVEGGRSEES